MERALHVSDHDLELAPTLTLHSSATTEEESEWSELRVVAGLEGTSSTDLEERGLGETFKRYSSWKSLEMETFALDERVDRGLKVHGDEETRRRLTTIWGAANACLPLGYFAIGFAVTFWVTPLQVYLVDTLNASPAHVNILMTLLDLPWSFKVFYGLLSDTVPIRGKRRKPYYLIGWALFLFANAALAILGQPGIGAIMLLTFLAVVGFLMSDVMCDAMVVERARYEDVHLKGEMQAIGYVLRYAGNILGSCLGTVVYNKKAWGWGLDISQVFWLNAGLTCGCALAMAYHLEDPGHHVPSSSSSSSSSAPSSPSTADTPSHTSGSQASSNGPSDVVVLDTRRQLRRVWDMVQRRSIYLPMAAIAWYNMFQVPNAAWTNFLIAGLGFDAWSLGLRMVAGTVFSWLGAMFYRSCLRHHSWRTTYTSTTLLVMAFSVLQLLLIFRVNVRWGVSDLWFSVGDDSIGYFVRAAQWFPLVTMYIGLCPEGSEGMAFAMLTTFSNVAGTVGSNIGTLLTNLWAVDNASLAAQRFDGVWKLTLLTSLLQPVGLALVWLLPRSTEHQKSMQKCQRRSFWGGVGFVAFLLAAWLWTLLETLLVMLHR